MKKKKNNKSMNKNLNNRGKNKKNETETPKVEVNQNNKSETQKEAKEKVKAESEKNTDNNNFEKEIETLKAKVQTEKEDYMRLMAEFETFRRRSAEEKLALVSSASSDTIKGLLPVLDDCERAMELLSKSSDEAAKEGTSLIFEKLKSYLKSKGLEKIEAKGKKFDTDFHEAVAQIPVPEEKDKGMVYDVVETGYLLNGKIIRFAKVVVGV